VRGRVRGEGEGEGDGDDDRQPRECAGGARGNLARGDVVTEEARQNLRLSTIRTAPQAPVLCTPRGMLLGPAPS